MSEENVVKKRTTSLQRDRITLELPEKPDYVMGLRLTPAAIMTRAGFNIDHIEDLKMAIAEAYTTIIRLYGQGDCVIEYQFEQGWTQISINLKNYKSMTRDIDGSGVRPRTTTQEDELSSYIIHSIMDDVQIFRQNGAVVGMTMVKGNGL